MQIGDLFFAFRGDGARLKEDAVKEGEAAGVAGGKALSASLKANVSIKGLFGAGAVLAAGQEAFHLLGQGIGEVVNAIPDLIAKGESFALTVQDITLRTGASAEEASRFAGVLSYLGIPLDGIGLALKSLAVQVIKNEDHFKSLGIATRTSVNGPLLNSIEILNNVRHYLSGVEDGAAKTALAVSLLGKTGASLIEFLNLSDAEALALNDTMDKLGVTIGAAALQNVVSLRREQSLLNLAFQGLANTLTEAVLPTVRQVIGGITDFIKTHGAEIRQTFVDITNAVLGFVSGLLGLGNVTPFQAQLDALSGSGKGVTLSFEQWAQAMGLTIPKIDKVTGGTKAATTAIDNQIKSVDNAIAAEKAHDAAAETIFQRTMTRLGAEYGAQLSALDLQERQLALADRDKALAQQLADARKTLFEAQAQPASDRRTLDVAKAQQGVLDAQKAIADEAAQRDRDAQRARLEGVKAYIENVAKLEADATNKRALAETLKRRDTKLTSELALAQAAKDATSIADITARLEAVKTAETRNAAAIKSGDKQDELGKLKTQLEAERAAVAASGAGQVTDNAKTLAALKADYATYVKEQETKTRDHVGVMENLVGGDPKKGTGLGGAIAKAFHDGQAAGEGFRKFLEDDLKPSLLGILDILRTAAGLAADLAKALGAQGLGMAGGAAIGARVGGLPGAVGGAVIGGIAEAKPGTMLLDPGGPLAGLLNAYDAVFGTHYGSTGVPPTRPSGRERAAGGPVSAGMPYIVGELRPELFVPDVRGTIMPSVLSWSGETGGQPAIIRVEVGGNKLIDYVDKGLRYRRR